MGRSLDRPMRRLYTVAMTLLLALLVAYPDSARFVARTEWAEALGNMSKRCSARDSSGTLHVVFSYELNNGPGQNSEIYYVRSTDSGLTWSDTFNVSMTGRPRSIYPALAIDRRGRLHCSWQEEEVEGEYIEIYYRCRDSAGWLPAERVSYQQNRGNRHLSSVACDTLSRVHLVWDACPSPVELAEVWYSIRDDSGWTPPENLTSNPAADDCAPLIALDGFDNILLTWNERAGRDRGAYRFKRGGQWSPKAILDTTWETGNASTGADGRGRFHATWFRGYMRTSDTLYLLYYARYDSAWSEPVLISESIHGDGVIRPGSMTVDTAGNVYAVWPRRFPRPGRMTQKDILYRTYDGQEWSPIVNLTYDSVESYCPHLGYPASGTGVDLFWTSRPPNTLDIWDVMYMWLSPVSAGVGDWPLTGHVASSVRAWPTIVANVLHLREAEPAAVYAPSGRKVADLQPGANDVRHLPPGVYFVAAPSSPGEDRAAPRKVIITR
jgi:hypothetical protein